MMSGRQTAMLGSQSRAQLSYLSLATWFLHLVGCAGESRSSQCLAPYATYFVAPAGDDEAPGTKAQPFATVERARLAVSQIHTKMKGDVIVYLRGGDHYLEHTLRMGPQDSGMNGHDVIYASHPGEQATLH